MDLYYFDTEIGVDGEIIDTPFFYIPRIVTSWNLPDEEVAYGASNPPVQPA